MTSDDSATNPPRGKPWTPAENAAAIEAYFWMLDQDQHRRQFNKAAKYRELESSAIPGRNVKSIERKMQNVSAVLQRHGIDWVEGLAPLANVQTDLVIAVEEALAARGMIDGEEHRQ